MLRPRRLLAIPLLALLAACTFAQTLPTKDPSMEPTIHAPDFPKTFAWLNTDQPLSFKAAGGAGGGSLKGQVVVMDFWCYCCINCMHILPDLEFLEQKYQDQPVVILGIHSNKYDNESDPANIRAAIQRYEIHHPIIVDEDHQIWDSYAVRSWPTLIVVGADGNIIGGVSGEGHRELLDKTIARALADSKAKGTLANAPLKLAREGQIRAASGLSFPGKVIPDPDRNRTFIVDSNHNRIVITTYPGQDARVSVTDIIGTGETGNADGTFNAAEFNRPQGGTLSGNNLYIADTENHLIRRIDLDKKTVTTILGNGKQDFDPEAGKTGRDQGLNSPWDVAIGNNRLYIAQAGQHQIFAMNLLTGATEVAAGSARENIRDGTAKEASLAQPSGMALDAKNQILYFADSETSALRGLDLKGTKVFTIIGHGLFDFGDIDGTADTARFQHALGVSLAPDGTLLLADTYNHKIKRIDPVTRTAKTLAGNGKPGTGTMGTAVQFFEPASIASVTATEAFVADTNNHRIVRLNPQTGAWSELIIEGLTTPNAPTEPAIDKDALDAGTKSLAADKDLALTVKLKLPANHHLTHGAPLSLKITDGTSTLYTATLSAPEAPLAPAAANTRAALTATIPAAALAAKPTQLYVTIFYTHCSEGLSAVCTPAKAAWKFAPTFATSNTNNLDLASP